MKKTQISKGHRQNTYSGAVELSEGHLEERGCAWGTGKRREERKREE